MLTSKVLKRDLKEAYGREWRAVADDLDNAIAEYGGWVDGKIHDSIEAYVEEMHDHNRSQPAGSWAKPDQDRMRELVDEEVQYWVHGRVRRYYSAMGASADGGITVGRTYYLEKLSPATYDSGVDLDFGDDDDLIQVWVE